ncbi:hypothetical protein D3C87_1928180 [compost metagenome]
MPSSLNIRYCGTRNTIGGRSMVPIMMENRNFFPGYSKRAKEYATSVHEISVTMTRGMTMRNEFRK